MRKIRNLLIMAVLFVSMFWIFSETALAANGWTLEEAAYEDNGTYVLTSGTRSKEVGAYLKTVPLDTRQSFEVSFRFYEGDVLSRPREGMLFVTANEPIVIGDYSHMGYWEYIYRDNTDLVFYGVEFKNSSINIVSRANTSRITLASSAQNVCDSAWHDVKITYANDTMSVFWDGTKVVEASEIDMDAISYLGFTAATSYYGCQKHAISNLELSGISASTVKLDANGGKCHVKKLYVVDKKGKQLPTPKRTSYIFQGWYTQKTGGTKIVSKEYDFKPTQTLYAHWKDNRKKVTFNANGGTVKEKNRIVNNKAKIGKLPTPTRKGYIFQGWYTKKSGGTKITSKKVIKEKSTFYAHWVSKNKKVKITLKKNGGSCSKSSITVKYGGKISGLPKATRKGYTFQGWYTKKSGGKKITSSTKTVDLLPTKTLYAHWKKKSSGTSSNSSTSGNSSSSTSGNSNGTRCGSCGGDGRKTCTACSGRGGKYVRDYVPNYSGSTSGPKWYEKWENCIKCSGSGEQSCTSCGGDGRR